MAAQVSQDEQARIEQAVPDRPIVKPNKPRRLLVFNRCDGFKHSSIPYWDKVLQTMANKTGAFGVQISSDMSVFTPENLSGFDAICLNNTTRLSFNELQRRALLDFVRSGKGLVGIHAATDNFYGWDEAAEMIGARFVKHPWTSDKTVSIKIEDPDHPLTRHWQGEGFTVNDEIYVTHRPFFDRSRLRVLMSLDMTDPRTRNLQGVGPEDLDTGISWVRSYGSGRVFYCSLGHNHHICWDRNILMHYLAGIQFALGDLQVQTEPIAYPRDKRVDNLSGLLAKASGYDFDKAPDGLYAIEQAIRQLDEDPAYRLAAEGLILTHLKGQGSLAWKAFLCRQLSNIGTERSMDLLMQMLKDGQTADMARFALERIDGPQVRSALLRALADLPPKVQIGVINTIGNWRDRQAVVQIATFLDGSDPQLREAAVEALAKIGTQDAAKALLERMDKADRSLRQVIADAAIRSADAMAADGLTGEAIGVYKRVYGSDCEARIRAAALSGWVRTDRSAAAGLVHSALNSQDQGLVVAACGMVDLIPDQAGRAKALDLLPQVPIAGRLAILTAIARTADRSLAPAVVAIANSSQGEVQMEAVRTLGVIGDQGCVVPLAQIAASSQGAVQQLAREALVSLRGEGVDKQLLQELERAQPKVQCELIMAMEGRSTAGASKSILKLASSDDQQVRAAAQRALGQLAVADDLPQMVRLLWANPSQDMEDAIVSTCRRLGTAQACTDALLQVYDRSGPQGSRMVVLRTVGRLGADNGLAVLLDQLDSSDGTIRTEAIRALSSWPDCRPMDRLWQIASQAGDQTERVLALRGYIRMVPMYQATSQQKVAMLEKAMSTATRDEERRLVLSVLPDCVCIEALRMAEAALGQPGLKAEAESAIVRLAGLLIRQQPDQVGAILEKVRAGTDDESIRQRINQILRRPNQRFRGD